MRLKVLEAESEQNHLKIRQLYEEIGQKELIVQEMNAEV